MKYKFILTLIILLSGGVSAQYFPTGGYQGGGQGSGGNLTLDVVVVDLKAYLQGAFDTTNHTTHLNDLGLLPLEQPYDTSCYYFFQYTGNESVDAIPHDSITDWIQVELRETSGPAADARGDSSIARRAGFILSNGTITDLDGVSEMRFKYTSVSKNLYPVIFHRNHLAVLSDTSLPLVDEVYAYDFTDAAGKAYNNPVNVNNPMASLPNGNHGLWAGEALINNVVQYYYDSGPALSDQGHIYFTFLNQKPAQVISGYHVEDINMNGVVRYHGKENDRLMIWKNTTNGVFGYTNIFGHVP